MPSDRCHARASWCRNRITRSPWAIPLILVFASPLAQGLAVSGTLVLGSGCTAPSYDECDQSRDECVELCPLDDYACIPACYDEHAECLDEADAAADRRAEAADVAAEIAVACAVAACTFSDEDDGDSDDGYDPEPAPEPDDWGEDWGEQVGEDAGAFEASHSWPDPPLDVPAD